MSIITDSHFGTKGKGDLSLTDIRRYKFTKDRWIMQKSQTAKAH